MRHSAVILGVAVLLFLPGCNLTERLTGGGGKDVAKTDPKSPPPQVDRLVAYLNDNAKRIQAVRSNQISIHCKQDGQGIGLDAMMVCQKPRSFRLKGKVLGKPAVDLGSNDEEFWYWINEQKPPYVFHCAYNDLRGGNVRLPFPFSPDMIVCALGIAEYDVNKSYKLEIRGKNGQYLELSEPYVTPQNKQATKITVFNRFEVRPPNPQVVGYILKDETGKEICTAVISEVTIDRATNAILPRHVELRWPEQRLEMTMKMSDVHSEQVEPQHAARLFSRADLSSYPAIDLARGMVDRPTGLNQGMSIQRVGGQMPVPR